MTLPTQARIEVPLLLEIERAGGEVQPKVDDIYVKVAEHFPEITAEDLAMKLSDGRTPRWRNRVQWARQALLLKGELASPERGRWAITEAGRHRLRQEGIATREPELPPKSVHAELKGKLADIGEILGKYARTEYPSTLFTYDVVWKEGDEGLDLLPSHVFEVQHHGQLDKALSALKHARDIWRASLFLIVTEERDRQKAEQLVRPMLAGLYHEIRASTVILTADDVRRLHGAITEFRDVMHRFVSR
jgi:hypothetical protein